MTARGCTEAIQEALFDDEALAVLPAWLARAAGARSAVIQGRHADGVHEVMAFNRYTADCMALYAWKFAPLDPWVRAARAEMRRDELTPLDDLVPAAVFERSRLYREFIRPQGDDTLRAAVAVFDGIGGEAIVSLHRGRREAPFAQSDIEPMSACMPHLGRVLRARGERLARRRRGQVARDDLDGVGLGQIAVDSSGRITRTNLTADQVLRRSDGFRTGAGLVSCADPGSRLRLLAALALATAPDNPIATVIPVERVVAGAHAERGERSLAYMVSVTPMRGEGGRPLAMLVFRDPDVPGESLAGRVRAFFRSPRPGPVIPVDLPDGMVGVRLSAGPPARA